MVAPRKYPEELQERSIRMTLETRKDPASRPGACRRIGEQLGITWRAGLRTACEHGHAPARERDATTPAAAGDRQAGTFIVSRSTGAL
jgi:transposase